MTEEDRKIRIRDVTDVLELIGGRWRGPILAYLCESPRRFSELKDTLEGITPRILIKELRYLEMNKMVYSEKSTISGNSVVYGLTEHGESIESVIVAIHAWAKEHRMKVFTDQ
ncbi:MAG TPA: transcriptional regulator [Microscillaceae bacterium]|nr:transcriptional regulator [Microscillaceae bacterium]